MKRLIPILLVPFLPAIANAQAKNPNDPCYWKDHNGICQTRAKLDEILQEHKKLVESEYKEGGRADLSDAYLSEANLSGADLSNAILVDARLDHTNLSRADLRGTNLRGTNLAPNL